MFFKYSFTQIAKQREIMLGLLSTVAYDTFGDLVNIYISRKVYVAFINKLHVTLVNNVAH